MDKQQPIRQARQRICYFPSSDVGMRSGHTQDFSGSVANRQAPAQHPAKAAVFVLQAVFTLEVWRQSSLMRIDFVFTPFTIRDMDSVQPLFEAVRDLVFLI